MTTISPSTARHPNAWWVGFVAGMATFVDQMALTGIGTAFVLYQASGSLTPTQVGILTGTSTIGVAVGAIAGGRLGDRFGRRIIFIITMLLVTVGATGATFMPSFTALSVSVAILGLGIGADLPVSLATISEAATDKNRAKILIFSNLLGTAGITAAIVTSTLVGGLGRVGAQILFGEIAVVGVLTLLLRLTVPESTSWKVAREEVVTGVITVRAQRRTWLDLFQPPYRRAMWTLLAYYTLTTLSVLVGGQFGTYVAVNVAKLDVQLYSAVSLLALPAAIGGALWFMKVADTRRRMPYYIAGSTGVVVSFLIPAVFGFTFVTVIASLVLVTMAGAFCYETMMKVWTQESFPVLIRSTAQGLVYFLSRVAAAVLAVVVPSLLGFDARALYVGLAVVGGAGLLIGYLGFRMNTRNEFDHEQEPDLGTDPRSATDDGTVTAVTEAGRA